MYKKIKNFIMTALFILLWARFFFLIGDPSLSGGVPAQGFMIYESWAPVIGFVYQVTGVIVMPFWWLYNNFGHMLPELSLFPIWYGQDLLATVTNLIASNAASIPSSDRMLTQLQSEPVRKALLGGVEWFTPIAMVVLNILSPIVDRVFEFVKNLVWNILIEFSFTRRKQQAYQNKLEERATDLMKLRVEYKNLSKEANELSEAIVTDELTNVYNKRFFLEKIKYEFNEARMNSTYLTLAMMDIDHFKKLNDTHGHLFGDIVLKEVAKTVKACTPKDAFTCRFGGEEFAMIMPGFRYNDAHPVAEAVRKRVEQLRFAEQPEQTTSISIGMCVVDFSSDEARKFKSADDLLQLADDELYRAKLGGRNRVNFITIEV